MLQLWKQSFIALSLAVLVECAVVEADHARAMAKLDVQDEEDKIVI